MALTPGLLLAGRYRLTYRIAIGGMGEVWAADDTRLARTVAIKILKSELTSDPEFVDRFRAEARITASLNHSGIAAVYDYGEVASVTGGPRNTAFLVMELVAGEPLSVVLMRTRRLSVSRTLDVLEQCGRALQVAHVRALVHRDIKPGNIMITPTGQVKITDFGIAKVAHQIPVTRGGMVMGTAQYLSPEQAAGQKSFPPSDVYSLGVLAYESLAGVRPFNSDNPLAVATAHVRDDPPPLPPDIPPAVAALVMRMLAKDPRRRFPDGAALARAVAAVRSGTPVPARPVPSAGLPAALPLTAAIAGGYDQPPYAPPVRAMRQLPERMPAARQPPVSRRTGVAVLIAILVLVIVGIAGAVVLTHTEAAGPSGGPPGTEAPASSSPAGQVRATGTPAGRAARRAASTLSRPLVVSGTGSTRDFGLARSSIDGGAAAPADPDQASTERWHATCGRSVRRLLGIPGGQHAPGTIWSLNVAAVSATCEMEQ